MAESSVSLSSSSSSPSVVTIAFVNFHSGGQMGPSVIEALRRQLGEANVFNLMDGGPKKGLLAMRASWSNLRVVAIGGDGTVNWVLSTIGEMGISPPPPVGIIPLGTGNDTARVFGWGFRYPGERGIARNVAVMSQTVTPSLGTEVVEEWLDRWRLLIKKEHSKDGDANALKHRYPPAIKEKAKKIGSEEDRKSVHPSAEGDVEMIHIHEDQPTEDSKAKDTVIAAVDPTSSTLLEGEFNNYLSFGIDAQNMFKFHSHREAHRGCYQHRLQNMCNMFVCGVTTCCCCQADVLQVKVYVPQSENKKVNADEKKATESDWSNSHVEWSELQLPRGLKSIVLLNLPSYAAGRNPWGTSTATPFVPQSYNDGLLEVFGIWGDVHLARIMINCGSGVRMGQFSAIKVVMSKDQSKLHVQIDGEAFAEETAEFIVTKVAQAKMLKRIPKEPKKEEMK